MSELARLVRLAQLTTTPRPERLSAGPTERAALAGRFDLLALDELEAELDLRREAGGVAVTGRIRARGAQPCAVSGEPVAFDLDEPVALRFAQHAAPRPDEEIELAASDLDTLPIEGDAIDVGEAVAQTLGLALNPYPRLTDVELSDVRQRLAQEEDLAARAEVERAANNPFRVIRGN